MRRLSISIPELDFDRLVDVAFAERRRPVDQAAWLVSEALRERPDAPEAVTTEARKHTLGELALDVSRCIPHNDDDAA
jgi:hypothetical protein